MARQLSDLQLAILDVLWEVGEATVGQVQAGLAPTRPLALTTVATLLARLAKRGVVTRRTEGRSHVYRAAVDRQEVRRSMVGALMKGLFGGDPEALMSHLVREGEVDAATLARLQARIEQAKGVSDDD